MPFPLATLVLNVTNKCNLSCTYCYEYGADKLTKDNAPVLLDGDGHDFTVWENGNYAAEFQDGRKAQIEVRDIPAAETVPPGWTVTFQKDRGAPEG